MQDKCNEFCLFSSLVFIGILFKNFLSNAEMQMHSQVSWYLNRKSIIKIDPKIYIHREKERFRADELQVALEESQLRYQNFARDSNQLQTESIKQVELLNMNNHQMTRHIQEESLKTEQLKVDIAQLQQQLQQFSEQ